MYLYTAGIWARDETLRLCTGAAASGQNAPSGGGGGGGDWKSQEEPEEAMSLVWWMARVAANKRFQIH